MFNTLFVPLVVLLPLVHLRLRLVLGCPKPRSLSGVGQVDDLHPIVQVLYILCLEAVHQQVLFAKSEEMLYVKALVVSPVNLFEG